MSLPFPLLPCQVLLEGLAATVILEGRSRKCIANVGGAAAGGGDAGGGGGVVVVMDDVVVGVVGVVAAGVGVVAVV